MNTLNTDDFSSNTSRVFPNPAQDVLMLDTPSNFMDGTLTIYDMLGRVVHNQTIIQESTSLDVTSYSSGLYILQLELGTQKQIIRFVKQ